MWLKARVCTSEHIIKHKGDFRERLPTAEFWPREFHRLYSPWDRKKSDTTEWLSHNSHGIHYSILSNTEPMGSVILRTGLKRMGLTLLLIIICISVGIKMIVACSACICKQATKIVTKKMPQTHVDIFHYGILYQHEEITEDRPSLIIP